MKNLKFKSKPIIYFLCILMLFNSLTLNFPLLKASAASKSYPSTKAEFFDYLETIGYPPVNSKGEANWSVYRDYNEIVWGSPHGRYKDFSQCSPGNDGEYQFLGYNVKGKDVSNECFPDDERGSKHPRDWNFVSVSGSKETWDRLKLPSLKSIIKNSKFTGNGATASSPLKYSDIGSESKVRVQSTPTWGSRGSIFTSNKGANGRIYYATFNIGKISDKKGSAFVDGVIDSDKNTYYIRANEDSTKGTVNVEAEANLTGLMTYSQVKELKAVYKAKSKKTSNQKFATLDDSLSFSRKEYTVGTHNITLVGTVSIKSEFGDSESKVVVKKIKLIVEKKDNPKITATGSTNPKTKQFPNGGVLTDVPIKVTANGKITGLADPRNIKKYVLTVKKANGGTTSLQKEFTGASAQTLEKSWTFDFSVPKSLLSSKFTQNFIIEAKAILNSGDTVKADAVAVSVIYPPAAESGVMKTTGSTNPSSYVFPQGSFVSDVPVKVTVNGLLSGISTPNNIATYELTAKQKNVNQPKTKLFTGTEAKKLAQTATFDFVVSKLFFANNYYKQPFDLTAKATLINGQVIQAPATVYSEIIPPNPLIKENLPPTVKIEGPDIVKVGQTVCLDSTSADPDGYIVDQYWETPSAQGTITGKKGCIVYPNEGEYDVSTTVVDDGGLTGDDTHSIIVVPPYPSADFEVSGFLKENRKVDIQDTSTSPEGYPINWNKSYWQFTPVSGGTYSDIKVKGTLNGNNVSKTLASLFKKAGEYRLKLHIENSVGETSEVEKDITIEPDEAPVVDFSTENLVYRDPQDSNQVTIHLTDESFSNDDSIQQRIWTYTYDSNNNGDFSDETPQIIDEDNVLMTEFTVNKVGKYKVELSAIEQFEQPTIDEFVTSADRRRGNTDSKPLASKIIEVQNLEPIANYEVGQRKTVNLQFFAGTNANNNLTTLQTKINSIVKPILNDNKIDLNLTVKSASSFSLTAPTSANQYTYAVLLEDTAINSTLENTIISQVKGVNGYFAGLGTTTNQTVINRIVTNIGGNGQFISNVDIDNALGELGDSIISSLQLKKVDISMALGNTTLTNAQLSSKFNSVVVPKLMQKGITVNNLFINDYNFLEGNNKIRYRSSDKNTTWGTASVSGVPTKLPTSPDIAGFPIVDGATYYYKDSRAQNSKWLKTKDYTTIPIQIPGEINFNGVDNYIDLGNKSLFNLTTATIEATFYPTSLAEKQQIVAKTEAGGYHIMFDPASSSVYARIQIKNTDGTTGYKRAEFPITDIKLNQWNHIAFSFTSTQAKLYHNGALKDTVDYTGTIVHSTVPLLIGAEPAPDPVNNAEFFKGKIKEVRLWNKVLTATEVSNNVANNVSPTATGLIGYWKLDLFSTGTVQDLTSKGNNGTLVNIDTQDVRDMDIFTAIPGAKYYYKSSRTGESWKTTTDPDTIPVQMDSTYAGRDMSVFPNVPGATYYWKANVSTDTWKKATSIPINLSGGTTADYYDIQVLTIPPNIDPIPIVDGNTFVFAIENSAINTVTLSEMKNQFAVNGAHLLAMGQAANQNQFQSVISAAGKGQYYDNGAIDTAFSNAADYIIQQVAPDTVGKEVFLTLDDEASYFTYFTDMENDPKYTVNGQSGEKWTYSHDQYAFENPLGLFDKNNMPLTAPVTKFNKTGAYRVSYTARDNPVDTNNAFDEYRKWSMPDDSYTIYVHRKPVPNFFFNINKTNGEYSIKNAAYDLDKYSVDIGFGGGISSLFYQWRVKGTTTWSPGLPPSPLDTKTYEVKQTVTDFQGASDSIVKEIVNTAANRPPVADFVPIPDVVQIGKTSLLKNYSFDPDGDDLTYQWWIRKVGTTTYTSFSTAIEPTRLMDTLGDYEVKLRATDPAGLYDEATKTIKVVNSNRAPVPGLTVTDPNYIQDYVEITSTAQDPDGDALSYYYELTKPDGVTKVVYQTGDGVVDGKGNFSFIPTNRSDIGTWKIVQKVTDTFGASATSSTLTFRVLDLMIDGTVKHTDAWQKIHNNKGHAPNEFYSGETFVLEALVSNYPVKFVNVRMNGVRTDNSPVTISTDLVQKEGTPTLFIGEITDPSFLDEATKLKKGSKVTFTFSVTYQNGYTPPDDVETVTILDSALKELADSYHRIR